MSQYATIVSENSAVLWGLSSTERIQTQLNAINIPILADHTDDNVPTDSVLLIDSNFIFDGHTIQNFANSKSEFLVCNKTHIVAALKCDITNTEKSKEVVGSIASSQILKNQAAALRQYNDHLRKSKPPLVLYIPAHSAEELESILYGNSYKGVTDFVTKWWWPHPAKKIVKLCVRLNITPNIVTGIGAFLMVLALFFFSQGFFMLGLVSGWVMTLLDTVDGKLARVTERTSNVGHALDHGMDILHPPIWYFYWGIGLPFNLSFFQYNLMELSQVMIYAYIGGRVIEGLFEGLGSCSMFAWKPIDAYFRLFVARRNPCLVILTTATILGQPESGFLGVVGWTLICTILLAMRLVYACYIRLRDGKLESWLQDPNAAKLFPTAFITFSETKKAYAK